MATDTRYNLTNFIAGSDKSFIQANTKRLKELAVNIYIIPPKHARRLDLISYYLYGTVNLKWVLLCCNEIIDLSVLEMGYKLKYPLMRDVLTIMSETSDYIN